MAGSMRSPEQIELFLDPSHQQDQSREISVENSVSKKDLAVFDRLQTPIWIFDIDNLKMWWANLASLRIWGASTLEDLLKRDFSQISEATAIRLKSYLEHFHRGETIVENWTFYPQEKAICVRCLCSGIQIEFGRMAMLVEGITEAISQFNPETLRSIEALRHTTVMISLYTCGGVPLMQNPAAIDCYGDNTLHPNVSTENIFRRHFVDENVAKQIFNELSHIKNFHIETRVFTKQGIRWHSLMIRKTHDPVTGDGIMLVNEVDITKQYIALQERQRVAEQLQILNRQLQNLAIIDQLTQIANRRHFDYTLKAQWNSMMREKRPLSLLLCDIDFFKQYNDTYGHSGGDSCLQRVAQTLKHTVQRSTDMVARYGGEEFAVILAHTDGNGALRVAENIHRNIKTLNLPHRNSRVKPYVTLSIGIATLVPRPDLTPTDLINRADAALYQAKASGRNCSRQSEEPFLAS